MAETQNNVVEETINNLHKTVRTIVLSTVNQANELETSYSPYVFDEQNYYIFTSGMAPHSQNMIENPNISFLLIEDESKTKNIFARTRLSYRAKVQVVEKDSIEFKDIIAKLTERMGKTVDLLTSLNDFNLFRISPAMGRLIIGFGQAYILNNQTKEIIHVDKDFIAQQNQKNN